MIFGSFIFCLAAAGPFRMGQAGVIFIFGVDTCLLMSHSSYFTITPLCKTSGMCRLHLDFGLVACLCPATDPVSKQSHLVFHVWEGRS